MVSFYYVTLSIQVPTPRNLITETLCFLVFSSYREVTYFYISVYGLLYYHLLTFVPLLYYPWVFYCWIKNFKRRRKTWSQRIIYFTLQHNVLNISDKIETTRCPIKIDLCSSEPTPLFVIIKIYVQIPSSSGPFLPRVTEKCLQFFRPDTIVSDPELPTYNVQSYSFC